MALKDRSIEKTPGDKAATQLRRGDRVELSITKLAYGGRGVGHVDGKVVFVAGAVPKDRVLAEITKSKRSYAEAATVEVVESSADRIAPSCQHGGEVCPGAPWQVLTYERQLEWKQQQVRDALERIGRFDAIEPKPIVAAVERWRYRNKLEYSFGGESGRGLALGFHARGRWWEVVDVDDCLLASETSNRVRNFVRDWCASRPALRPYERRGGAGFLRNLVVRESRRRGELQVELVTAKAAALPELSAFDPDEFRAGLVNAFPEIASVLWTATDSDSGIDAEPTVVLAGGDCVTEELAGLQFSLSSKAFFQTNTEMAEQLFAVALEYADLSGREKVFDLYCGIGTIALISARQASEVYGIDIVEQSIRDAISNGERNSISNAHFFCGNARTAIRPLIEQVGPADVAIVDPPRSGLSQKIVRRLLETEAKRIVYISCNPTTMAPNLRQIVDAGYELKAVRPVDMFPQTPHIESVALLTK